MELGFSPLVVTKPDKPRKRGHELLGTPIREKATSLGLEIWPLETLREAAVVSKFKEWKPDLIVSIAYGGYIPKELLTLPSIGCVNLHPSLLPHYRGAAPVQRALMAGETETGLTLATVSEQWDAGDILFQERHAIDLDDNAGTLLERLAHRGASLISSAIPSLLQKKIVATPQDGTQATYAPKIQDEETWIGWSHRASDITNQIRGLAPTPGARTHFPGGVAKIFKAQVVPGEGLPGSLLRLEKEGPVVGTGERALLLLFVQPENRKVMTGKDLVNGYRLQENQSFHD